MLKVFSNFRYPHKLAAMGLLILFCLTAPVTSAQNYKADLQQHLRTMDSIATLDLELLYNLYPTYTATKVEESQKVLFRKRGTNLYAKQGTVETVIDKDYALMVDHENHSVTIQRATAGKPQTDPLYLLDSLLAGAGSITLLDQPQEKCYKIDVSNLETVEYNQIHVWFSKKTGLITKVVMFYPEVEPDQGVLGSTEPGHTPFRVELIYRVIPTSNTPVPTVGSYIRQQQGKISLTTTYKAYQLYNYLVPTNTSKD